MFIFVVAKNAVFCWLCLLQLCNLTEPVETFHAQHYYTFIFQVTKEAENLTLTLLQNDSVIFSSVEMNNMSTNVCLNRYHGERCIVSFQSLTVCSSGLLDETNIFVSNTVTNPISVEKEVGELLFALDLYIKPSDECRSAVTLFLCLYTLGLCGTDNEDYRPTAAECMEIRDFICETEWKKAADLLTLTGRPPLPDCSTFGDEGLECDYGRLTYVA